MTTIVWDGKTLAADGRMTTFNTIAEENRAKIFIDTKSELRGSTVICYALAGSADMTHRVGTWIAEGCPHDIDWKDAHFELIIITAGSAYVYSDESNDILEIFHATTLGSGGDFAKVGLHMGKDARACVKLAGKMDMFTGGIGTHINCCAKKLTLKEFEV